MKTLSRKQFEAVESWVQRHGRALEAACFAVLFRNEPAETFLNQLAAYQNPDGGFGHALEPDLWNPLSTPYVTQVALGMMASLGCRDAAQWHKYVPRPSSAIPSPDSPLYPGNEDAIRLELDWLIDTLPQDDVWPINWSWGDNARRYPRENALMQEWWKARAATEKLVLLRRFARLA